jgi:hypothetical protein
MKKNFFNLYYQLNLLLRWSNQGVGGENGGGVNKGYKCLITHKLKVLEQRLEAIIMVDAEGTGYEMYPYVS